MKIWMTSFLLIFGLAEFYQWAKEITLPMPIFVLGGALLAIASNYDKLTNFPLPLNHQAPETPPPNLNASQAPVVSPAIAQPQPPAVSFEIRKPFQPGD